MRYLKEIRRHVTEVLEEIYEARDDDRFDHEAVNWGSLHVVTVAMVFEDLGGHYILIEVEEAAPKSYEFIKCIYAALQARGVDTEDFVIKAEW